MSQVAAKGIIAFSDNRPQAVVVVASGPKGPQGPQGIPGSGGGTSLNFTQASPSTTWTINHNFGFWPATKLFTVGGLELEGEVNNPSLNQTVVTFAVPLAGKARLN